MSTGRPARRPRWGACPVAQAEVLRCRLQSLEAEDEAARLRFFGAGQHVCLGRATSLDLFEKIVAHLRSLPVRVDDLVLTLRDDDVFAYPEILEASVLA